MANWLFFDLGLTLIDESECAEYRTRELLKQRGAPSRTACHIRTPQGNSGFKLLNGRTNLRRYTKEFRVFLKPYQKITAWAFSLTRARKRSGGFKNMGYVNILI